MAVPTTKALRYIATCAVLSAAGCGWLLMRNDAPPRIVAFSPATTLAVSNSQPQDGTYVMPDESMPTAPTTAPYKPRFELATNTTLEQQDAVAYRWLTPDTDAVSVLAGELGISNPSSEVPKADGGGWRAGGLLVLPNANWSFRADLSGVTCVDPAGCSIQEAVDLPDDAAASRLALKFLRDAASGVQVTSVERDESGITISLEAPTADGAYQTPFSVTIGSHGKVMAATGMIGTPAKVGSYPTVSLQTALVQLNERPQLRKASKKATTCTGAISVCMPEVLKLTTPRLTTKLFVSQDQSLWIVPAYSFIDQLGSIWVTEAATTSK